MTNHTPTERALAELLSVARQIDRLENQRRGIIRELRGDRVPVRTIADYAGLSPATVSRIGRRSSTIATTSPHS